MKNMRSSLIMALLPFMLCAISAIQTASAEEIGRLRGKVIDGETGDAIAGVVVKALGKTGKVLSFGSTGKDGVFSIAAPAHIDSLSFRCMGYEMLCVARDTDLHEIRLTPRATRLNDVVVDAPDIYARGDTLVFNVGRYANAKDNAIIDVIKRLPGIKVEDDGTIKYQGKPINRFYLDGNDFISGQYGLATNNISHKDVKSVEIMENHQPVKALEGIEFPEEAGINLRLKEDARSRWVGVGQAAMGYEPLLYSGSIFTMRLASKVQNVFTLKGDNTGWNPESQIREHDFDGMFPSGDPENLWREYITADAVNAPLSEKRTRDNLSWIANGISSWRKGDTSMRFKLNYMGDRLDYSSRTATDYFSDVIPSFLQDDALRTRSHDLSAQFNAEVNKSGYYLKDKLNVSSVWDNAHSTITGSFDLNQRVVRHSLSVVNDLKLVKRNDRNVFTLTSRNSFNHSPDRLTVEGNENAFQRLGTTDLRSTTETKFGKFHRFWKLYIEGGVDIDWHRTDVSLNGMGAFDNSGVCNAFISSLYATPSVEYERDGWRCSLGSLFRWRHQSIDGQHDYLDLLPRLYVRKQLTSRSEFSGTLAYRLGSPKPYMEMDRPVMSDYRNLFIAGDTRGRDRSVGITLNYRYRNPLKSLFMNASASYNYQRWGVMSNQLFVEDFVISTFSEKASGSRSWYFNAGVSKGLGRSRMVTGFDVRSSFTSASTMRDDAVVPFRQSSVNVKPYFKGSIVKWLSLNYEASYTWSRLRFHGTGNASHSFSQNLFLTVLPVDYLDFTAGAEHFLTRFSDSSVSNLFLFDASATWRINGKVRLSLTANNLLDRRRYEYVNYGTLSRSEYSFRLRPRNILLSLQVRF